MILIYSNKISPRLQYISDFIFKERMQVEFRIITSIQEYIDFTGPKICYSKDEIDNNGFWIKSQALLFETTITEQQIHCFEMNQHKAFYETPDCSFPFDIFAAAFYLITRYEEYLPHQKDMYGRYAHENSLAFKEKFLQQPLINYWISDFAKSLSLRFNSFKYHFPVFSFQPTYDIDIAFSYKHKGFLRNFGGFLKSPSLERLKVLFGSEKDPFDSFSWLNELHQQYKLKPIYFYLLANKNGLYDKNILPSTEAMANLIRQQSKINTIGIHPSWQSGDNTELLFSEKTNLQLITNLIIQHSRQHYIRFNFPNGYRRLIEAGITKDYSMGYGSINGFRASVASSHYWFDLKTNQPTTLRIYPFCFMEANSYYEQIYSAQQAGEELFNYYKVCKNVNGELITIWHNHFLGTAIEFKGWREIYQQFIAQVQQ